MKLNTSSSIGPIGCGSRWQGAGAFSLVQKVRGNELAHGETPRLREGRNFDPFRHIGLHVENNLSLIVSSSFPIPRVCAFRGCSMAVAEGQVAEAHCCAGAPG